MAIRFAAKETSPEPSKPKKQAVPAQGAAPKQETAVTSGEAGEAAPVPAAADLFGSEPKKAPRGRKAK